MSKLGPGFLTLIGTDPSFSFQLKGLRKRKKEKESSEIGSDLCAIRWEKEHDLSINGKPARTIAQRIRTDTAEIGNQRKRGGRGNEFRSDLGGGSRKRRATPDTGLNYEKKRTRKLFRFMSTCPLYWSKFGKALPTSWSIQPHRNPGSIERQNFFR